MLNHDMKWSPENVDEAKTSEQKDSQNLYCTLFSTARPQTRERGGCEMFDSSLLPSDHCTVVQRQSIAEQLKTENQREILQKDGFMGCCCL